MTEDQKAWIDNASYEDLFRKMRFAPIGDPMFQGEVGDYFMTVFNRRRSEVGIQEHVNISKKLGWEAQ